jgi:hypothetical protein
VLFWFEMFKTMKKTLLFKYMYEAHATQLKHEVLNELDISGHRRVCHSFKAIPLL